jgi:LysR family glycine cleavage system transcriptional activator
VLVVVLVEVLVVVLVEVLVVVLVEVLVVVLVEVSVVVLPLDVLWVVVAPPLPPGLLLPHAATAAAPHRVKQVMPRESRFIVILRLDRACATSSRGRRPLRRVRRAVAIRFRDSQTHFDLASLWTPPDRAQVLRAMDRLKKIGALWPYLPTFRVVAELEHITRAAAVLGVTPSAVSRTVGIVEEGVGQALFARRGRRIVLNEAGQTLLGAVRAAMRGIDEGIATLADRRFVGAVRVAAVEPFWTCLSTGTFTRLGSRHPHLVPTLTRLAEGEVGKQILTGIQDVAFVRHCPPAPHLVIGRVASYPTAVYAPRGHPVLVCRKVSAVAQQPSVDVTSARHAPSPWPAEVGRRVTLVVSDYDLALDACLRGGLLAILPVVMAAPHLASGALMQLRQPVTHPVVLFAVSREPVGAPGRAEAVVAAAREEAAEEAANPPRPTTNNTSPLVPANRS